MTKSELRAALLAFVDALPDAAEASFQLINGLHSWVDDGGYVHHGRDGTHALRVDVRRSHFDEPYSERPVPFSPVTGTAAPGARGDALSRHNAALERARLAGVI